MAKQRNRPRPFGRAYWAYLNSSRLAKHMDEIRRCERHEKGDAESEAATVLRVANGTPFRATRSLHDEVEP
jgi:hypothetical protein